MNSQHQKGTIDMISFVIEECTMIASVMRKSNKATNGPLASFLTNQFIKDGSPFIDEDSTPRLPSFLKSTPKSKEDDHFLSGFVELRSILTGMDAEISEMDVLTLLQPFLIVIRSPNTSGFITGVVVNSLSKLIKYGIINPHNKNIHQGLGQLISALSHCKFEGSDQTQDDILLIKIIQLVELTVLSDLGDLLTDDSMYESVSTCFSLAANTRRRDILRSTAETTLINITQKMFSKLKDIESTSGDDHNVKGTSVELSAAEGVSMTEDTIGGTEVPHTPESPENPMNGLIDAANETSITAAVPVAVPSIKTQLPNESSADLAQEQEDEEEEKKSNITIDDDGHVSIASKFDEDTPFGLPSMKEYLTHTVEVLSPKNTFRYTESLRVLALNILNTIIEVSGGVLPQHSQLFQLISDNVCHHMVNILQTTESPFLLSLILKLFLHLSINMPHNLKIQLELIFNTLMQIIISKWDELEKDLEKTDEHIFGMTKRGKYETAVLTEKDIEELSKEFHTGKSASVKELVIESLSALWIRSPYFFINLFKSYDCDFDRTDLSVSLIKLICRLSSSDASVYTTQNVPPICMEGLLSLVDGIHDRIKLAAKNNITLDTVKPHPLILQQKKKSDFIKCVKQWNKKPAKGLELLYEKGFIKDKNDVIEYAKFLFEKSGRIDKSKLGELLSKPERGQDDKKKGKKKDVTPIDPNKKTLLKEFLKHLDFKNLRTDEALRMMLNNFRLPGEAQQIDRIIDAFSQRYVECQDIPDQVESDLGDDTKAEGEEEEEEKVSPDQDSLQILSFSIIMLNTDLHNPNIAKPMSLEDYQKNVRGCYNGGQNFPSWYTAKIYHSIKEREIIMPEEHKGSAKWFEATWHNLVAEQESKLLSEFSSISLVTDNGESVEELLQFDRAIFESTARHLIANLITMFDDATNDGIVTRMMSTVEKAAYIASYFGMNEIVDLIVEISAHMTTLTGVKKSEFALESREFIPITELKLEKENETITVSDLAVLFGRDFRAQLSTVVLFRVLKRSNYRVTPQWVHVVKIFLTLFENGLIEPDFFPEFQKKLGLEKLTKPRPEHEFSRTKALKDTGLFSTFSSYLKGLSDDTPEPTDEEIECTLSTIDCIKSSNIDTLFKTVSKTSAENLNNLVSILITLIPDKKTAGERVFMDETLLLIEVSVCYLLLSGDQKLVAQLLEKIDSVFTPVDEFKMSKLVRVNAYKLLLLHNGTEENKEYLNKTIDGLCNLSKTSRESLVRFGSTILQPLQMLVLTKGTWCQSVLAANNKYWSLVRILASTPKNTDIVYQFVYNLLTSHPELVTYENYMDILGLLDEISAVGAYGAQWEQEYDKLTSSGLKVEKNKNPFQELVATATKSISLTTKLADIIETQRFHDSIPELNKDGKTPTNSWYPLIEAISHQCYNPCREIRAHALGALKTLLLAEELPLKTLSADLVLDAGCIRLLLELMKPEVESTDPKGMVKTQKDVLDLTSKAILTYEFDNLNPPFSKLLTLASTLLLKNKHRSNSLEEEVLETIKNALLVNKGRLDLGKLAGLNIDKSLKLVIKEVSTSAPAPVPVSATENVKTDEVD